VHFLVRYLFTNRKELCLEKNPIIFLTGFMGSGKSTVGPILANTIGFKFVDLDNVIEAKVGKKITDIFAHEGEKQFRILERKTLEELLSSKSTVMSLGGGTVTNLETLDLVKNNGIMVYLRSDVGHIYQRLRLKGNRPMLRDENGKLLDGENLKQKIKTLLSAREPYYEQAHVIITIDELTIGRTVDRLSNKLLSYIEQ
jgi:shikimate kinase